MMLARFLSLLLLCFYTASAAPAPVFTARVVRGKVFAKNKAGEIVRVRPGMTFDGSWEIVTGKGSSVDLAFNDNSGTLRLGQDGKMEFNTATTGASGKPQPIHITLESGELSSSVQMANNSKLEITCGRCSVQMSQCACLINANGKIEVQSGQASYQSNNSLASVAVVENQTFSPDSSGAPKLTNLQDSEALAAKLSELTPDSNSLNQSPKHLVDNPTLPAPPFVSK